MVSAMDGCSVTRCVPRVWYVTGWYVTGWCVTGVCYGGVLRGAPTKLFHNFVGVYCLTAASFII